MRLGDARFQVVRHHQLWHTSEELEGPDVGSNPVGQCLAPGRLCIAVIGRPKHCHEDLSPADLPGIAINDWHSLAGIVHKQLLSSPVVLTHHHVQLALPGPIVLAKPAVLIPLWMGFPVLLPDQEKGDVLAPQLLFDPMPVRYDPGMGWQVWRGRK